MAGNISLPEQTFIQARNSHLPRTISDAASIVARHTYLLYPRGYSMRY
jgi:hypothetical protein